MLTTQGWHYLQAFLGCLVLLGIYDAAFCLRTPGRWFSVHAFANGIVVIFCIPAMIQWARAPLSVVSPVGQETPDPLGENWTDFDVLFHPSNAWCVLMIVAVHTYHCIAFKLSAQDVFHHFVFVPTIGVGGGLLSSWGPIRAVTSFFISGLPGGIDYINLVRLKRGHTTKLAQKLTSAKLNAWLRGPGCGVLVPATIFAAWSESRVETDPVTTAKLVLLAGFCAYNGLHYMEESIKNYQMHLTRSILDKKHAEKMEEMKQSWKLIESETRQRTSTFNLPELLLGRERSSSTSYLTNRKNNNREFNSSSSLPSSPDLRRPHID